MNNLYVSPLVSASDTVLPLLADFLWSFCEDEVVSVYGSEGSLASAIYIIEVAMANMEGANDIVDTLVKCECLGLIQQPIKCCQSLSLIDQSDVLIRFEGLHMSQKSL